MKIKNKTVKHIKNFVALIKNNCFNYSLKHLYTDLKHKYLILKNWFIIKNITWKSTMFYSDYSPEENDIFKQLNCTIYKLTQAMLKNSNLSFYLWSEVIKTAVYIKNQFSA